MTEKERKDSDC